MCEWVITAAPRTNFNSGFRGIHGLVFQGRWGLFRFCLASQELDGFVTLFLLARFPASAIKSRGGSGFHGLKLRVKGCKAEGF